LDVELRPGHDSSAELTRLLALDRKFAKEGLTFDDVLLVPAESQVLPNDVSTRTRLTGTIELAIPVVSAAMDTVTEARLAIALAREGGIGIVHRNLSIEAQVAEVDKVKRSESGMIVEPVTLPPSALVRDALDLMARYKVSGVPITDGDNVLVGILTNRDLRFEDDVEQPVSALMTSRNLVTAPVGTTLAEAEEILHRNKIEKLPVVDADGRLRGLITVKDIQKKILHPDSLSGARARGRRRGRGQGRHRAGLLRGRHAGVDGELDVQEHRGGRRRRPRDQHARGGGRSQQGLVHRCARGCRRPTRCVPRRDDRHARPQLLGR
jgi:IMP dehydrogenase